MESILTSIKKLLGPREDDTSFDVDIIMGINTALSILTQIGVGPVTGFSISDKTTVWNDYLPNVNTHELVKTYVYLKVKLIFDPPGSSAVVEVINRQLSELEWRISILVESGEGVV